jgi:hypothetical protein
MSLNQVQRQAKAIGIVNRDSPRIAEYVGRDELTGDRTISSGGGGVSHLRYVGYNKPETIVTVHSETFGLTGICQ